MINTIERFITGLIGMINTRANIIAYNETIKRYFLKSALYKQAIYLVTLDRLMQEYEDNK